MQSIYDFKKIKTNHIILLGLCISLFVFFLKDINKLNGIVVINDEFGYWGIASHLAGNTWSGLLPTAPYYAFGYSLLLVPLYWLNLSPTEMYHIAIMYNALFIVISFLISIACLKKIFPFIIETKTYLICFALSFYTNNIIQAQIAWSETLLYLLVWLLLYLLILNIKKPKMWNYCFGFLTAVYMYYVHQRMIGIVLVYIAVILFDSFYKKKKKILIITFLIGFLFLFFCGNKLKINIIDNVFTDPELSSMNDFSGQVGKLQSILFTWSGFQNFLQSIVGKFYYIGISTFLIGLGGLWIVGRDTFGLCKNLVKYKFRYQNDKEIISAFVFLGFISVFLIDAISMYNNAGRLDLLVYGRYMEPAFGMIILYGLTDLVHQQDSKKVVIPQILILLCLSFIINSGFIESGSNMFNGFCSTTIYFFFKSTSEIVNISFYITLILILPGCIVWILNTKKVNASIYNLLLTFIIMIVSWGWLSSVSGAINQQTEAQNNIGGIIEKINDYEDYEIVYVKNRLDEATSEGDINIKYLQFYFPNSTIKIVDEEEAIKMQDESDVFCVIDNNSKAFEKLTTKYKVIETTKVFTLFYGTLTKS